MSESLVLLGLGILFVNHLLRLMISIDLVIFGQESLSYKLGFKLVKDPVLMSKLYERETPSKKVKGIISEVFALIVLASAGLIIIR